MVEVISSFQSWHRALKAAGSDLEIDEISVL